MHWENRLENKYPKNRKNSKNQSEIAACEKTTSEKANFRSNTVLQLQSEQFQLDSKTMLNSASKLKANKPYTNVG